MRSKVKGHMLKVEGHGSLPVSFFVLTTSGSFFVVTTSGSFFVLTTSGSFFVVTTSGFFGGGHSLAYFVNIHESGRYHE